MHKIYNQGILICCFLFLAILSRAEVPSEADFNKVAKTFTLNTDGSQEFRCSKELTLHSHPAMNSTYGETFIVYNPDFQKLVIHSSYTRMVDGTIVKTPDNAFNEVLPRFAAEAPAYNGLKEMVVTHTGLELGTTIYLDYSIITKSGFYQQLDIDEILPESSPVKEYSITITVPEKTIIAYSLTGTKGVNVVKTERKDAGQRHLIWTLKKVPAFLHEPYQPENNPNILRLSASTYSSQKDALSILNKEFTKKTYSESETFATFITDSLNDNTKKVSVILNYVLGNVAYIPVPLEISGYLVRNADEVLRSAYGTKAEKANLLATMLRAVDISAEIVTIYPSTLVSEVCGLKAIKDLLVKVTLNGHDRFLSVEANTASLLPFRGKLDRVCTLTGTTIELTSKPVITSCSYDIALSASEAVIKATIVTDSDLFPLDYSASVKQWVGTNNVQITKNENGTITITFTDCKSTNNKSGYFVYKLPEITTYTATQLNSKRNTIFEIPYLSKVTCSYNISLAQGLKLQTPEITNNIKNQAGSFELVIDQKASQIKINRSCIINTQHILPDIYKDFWVLFNACEAPQGRELLIEAK